MKRHFLSESAWVIGFILLFIFIKTAVFSFYLVPSQSMEPNIIPGDRVFVNKLSYGFWIPFFDKPLLQWGFPKRGEILVFASQDNTYVKRVIGLPHDLIAFQKGVLFVNGQKVAQTLFQHQEAGTWGSLPWEILEERSAALSLPSHFIFMSKQPGKTYFETQRFLVPKDKVFVLGDNRDSSLDSRAFGFVEKSSFYGKASFVLFSTTGRQDFLPEFRMERFFKKID